MQIPFKYEDREAWLHACKDLFFFCHVVLAEGYPDKFHDFGDMHRRICNFLDLRQHPSRKKFLSAFRGSLKTTALLGFCLWVYCWTLLRAKATSIIYQTATKDNAENFYLDFKHCLLENPLLQYIFGLPGIEGEYVKMSKRKVLYNHVNMDFSSTEETLVSRHHPWWVNDDLENDKNTRTATGRNQLHRDWAFQQAILTKSKKKKIGYQLETGTPYHYDGLIWGIQQKPKYDKLMIPCYVYDKDGTRHSAWPEFYDVEDFEEKEEDMGSHIFSSQYLLLPLSEKDVLCNPKWVQRWNHLPDVTWRTCVIDAGGMDPEINDATGITIIDTDVKGDMYEVHTEEFWGTSVELYNKILEIKEKFNPDDTRLEKEKYAVTIADLIEHKAPQLNVSFVEHQGRSKGYKAGDIQWQGRIWRMQTWFQKGRFFFHPTNYLLSTQATRYPYSERDDLVDSLAYHLDIRRVPKNIFKPRFTPQIEPTFEAELDRYLNIKKGNDRKTYHDSIY